MTIYIVRPKASSRVCSLDLISRKFTSESRQKQWQEVNTLEKERPQQKQIAEWIADAQNREALQVLTSPGNPGITGNTVVNTSDEEAEQMRRDLPEIDVFSNQPLELIQPHKASNTFKRETELQTTDLWHLNEIGLETLQNQRVEASGQGVVIAVLDTGVDSSHPALRGKIARAYEFDVNQWQARPISTSLDTDGHGTHVAGLICGEKIGVAPEAKVISGVMLPQGRGSLAAFILALEWVAQETDVQIVNISAGLRGYLSEMEEAIANLLAVGVLPICAIGNDGRDKTCSPGNYRNVLSVGATNQNHRVANFSSGATLTVDNHVYTVPYLVAPGEQVYSSVVQGGYEAWDGTSMAAPIVSGVAALILERYPQIAVLSLREELLSRCKSLKEPKDRQGEGIVQLETTA